MAVPYCKLSLMWLCFLLTIACGSTQPTMAPTVPTTVLGCYHVLSGQSNARELKRYLDLISPCKVIGWAEGGDAIVEWGANGAGWLGWLKPALQQPGVQAFIWSQGETDAEVVALVAAYPDALAELFGRVRSAAGNPHLRIVVVEVSMRDVYASMRAVQKAYVASDPDARLVNTEDLRDNGGHFFPEDYPVIASRIVAALR